MANIIPDLFEAQDGLKRLFYQRFGRDITNHEENIGRMVFLQEPRAGTLEAAVNAMFSALLVYIARTVAVTLQAYPHVVYAKPIRIHMATSAPGGRVASFPAALYKNTDDRDQDVHQLYIVGVQPQFMKRLRHAKYEHWVVSHGAPVTWDTVRDPRYFWAWPHGACWLSTLYPPDVFASVDDPLHPTVVFGRTTVEELGWKDKS